MPLPGGATKLPDWPLKGVRSCAPCVPAAACGKGGNLPGVVARALGGPREETAGGARVGACCGGAAPVDVTRLLEGPRAGPALPARAGPAPPEKDGVVEPGCDLATSCCRICCGLSAERLLDTESSLATGWPWSACETGSLPAAAAAAAAASDQCLDPTAAASDAGNATVGRADGAVEMGTVRSCTTS